MSQKRAAKSARRKTKVNKKLTKTQKRVKKADATTKAQMKFLDRTKSEFGNVEVDWDGTYQTRAVSGDHRALVVTSMTPDGVRLWVLDSEGDIVMEGGAEV